MRLHWSRGVKYAQMDRRPPAWARMLPAHRPGAAVGVTLKAPVVAAIRSILTTP